MNDFDEAFELIGGMLFAITLLLILLSWLESTLTSDAQQVRHTSHTDAGDAERLPDDGPRP